jgi:hypothetical protein
MNPRKCLAKHISVGQSLPIPRSWTKETETPIQNTQAPAELGCRLQGMLETYLSTGFPLLSGDFAGFCSCVRAAGSPSPARLRYQIFRFLGPCCPLLLRSRLLNRGLILLLLYSVVLVRVCLGVSLRSWWGVVLRASWLEVLELGVARGCARDIVYCIHILLPTSLD